MASWNRRTEAEAAAVAELIREGAGRAGMVADVFRRRRAQVEAERRRREAASPDGVEALVRGMADSFPNPPAK